MPDFTSDSTSFTSDFTSDFTAAVISEHDEQQTDLKTLNLEFRRCITYIHNDLGTLFVQIDRRPNLCGATAETIAQHLCLIADDLDTLQGRLAVARIGAPSFLVNVQPLRSVHRQDFEGALQDDVFSQHTRARHALNTLISEYGKAPNAVEFANCDPDLHDFDTPDPLFDRTDIDRDTFCELIADARKIQGQTQELVAYMLANTSTPLPTRRSRK